MAILFERCPACDGSGTIAAGAFDCPACRGERYAPVGLTTGQFERLRAEVERLRAEVARVGPGGRS